MAHLLALRPATDPAVVRYGHVGHADASAFQQDPSGTITKRTIGLSGGVILTRTGTTPSSADVWSYPNLHGDVAATADGQGAKVGATFTYDPFGQPLAGDPDTTGTDFSYGWVGSESKLTERAGDIRTVQMGARQYVPGLGRFLSVDPIEGGCANDYVYVFGDPVNESDLDGRNALSDFLTGKCPKSKEGKEAFDRGAKAGAAAGVLLELGVIAGEIYLGVAAGETALAIAGGVAATAVGVATIAGALVAVGIVAGGVIGCQKD